jgi:curved DNA-binding protein
MKYVDYYAALGLARDATLEQIKKAYRTRARQHHPDMSKAPDAEEQFKNVAAAYATLKNPEKRAAYDALGPQQEGADMDAVQRQRAGFGGFSGFGPHSAGPGVRQPDMDFSEFLDSLGKGGLFGERHQRARGPQRGLDLEDTVLVDLAQALHGSTLHMALMDQGVRRELEVTIPAGVRAGQKLRLRGQGGKGLQGGANGDFYLHVAFNPHPRFRVDRQDLYFDLPLSPWEAMLGADITVPTLEGEVVLSVPAGSSSGRKLRLRARGLPDGADSGTGTGVSTKAPRGDMYALVRLDVPAQLTPEERKLVEELARISSFSPRPQLGPTSTSTGTTP